MGLEYRLTPTNERGEERWVPFMVCDECDEPIKDGSKAHAVWADPPAEARRMSPRWVHTPGCDKRRDAEGMSEELSVAFVYLLHNSKIDVKDAEERARSLAEM